MEHKLECQAHPTYIKRMMENWGVMGMGDLGNGKCTCGANSPYNNLMSKAIEVHDKKSHDYALADNKYSNFERASLIASWFNDPIDKVFATMIGIKLARLAELKNGKEAKNESVEDSHIDHVNYAALWGSYSAISKVGN